MQIRKMRKDFPFLFAFVVAILLHASLGFVLKFLPLNAAIANTLAPKTPLTVRFVEVPGERKTPDAIPGNTNRPKEDSKAIGRLSTARQQALKPERKVAKLTSPPSPNTPDFSKLPEIQNPPVSPSQPDSGDYEVPRSQDSIKKSNPAQLSKSLGDLDRYIGNSGSPKQGNGGTADNGSGVFFDTQGYDLGPWGNKVVAIVRSNWLIPVAAEMGSKGVVAISFQVDRMGNIINLNVSSPSSVPSFNQAALNALRSSNPFPPLPADFPRPVLPAVFRFFYNTPVED